MLHVLAFLGIPRPKLVHRQKGEGIVRTVLAVQVLQVCLVILCEGHKDLVAILRYQNPTCSVNTANWTGAEL